jgi:hypothetical protein
MGDLQVMSASMDSDPDIALFREDLVILKRDVASLSNTSKVARRTTFKTPPTKLNRTCGASSKKRGRKVNARPRSFDSVAAV